MSSLNKYYLTPLFRTILDKPEPGEIIEFPDYNYTRYNLFVLRTKLRVLIWKAWNREDIRILFETKKFEGKLYIQATPMIGNKINIFDLSKQIQYSNMIKKATSCSLDYAVVFSGKDIVYRDINIPGFWVLNILPYLNFPVNGRVKHRMGFYGLEVNVYGFEGSTGYPSFPADFRNVIEYIETYTEIETTLTTEMIRRYKRGYYFNPPLEIIKKWNLKIKHDSKTKKGSFYSPNWIDRRITNPYGGVWNFIHSRVIGDTRIKLRVGGNLVKYHRISKIIPKALFCNYNLVVNIEDLKEANQIIFDVKNINDDIGKVCVFRVISEKYIKDYIRITNSMNLKDTTFYYKDDAFGYELFFSCELNDLDLDVQIVIDTIKRKTLKFISH